MKPHRDTLIESATAEAKLPHAFAAQLIAEAPWLDGTEELSEEIGLDLLSDEALGFNLDQNQLASFIEGYNDLVRASINPYEVRQTEAYIAMGQALAPYGKADAFGEGDYWLVSDSFSGKSPVLLLSDEFRLPPAAMAKLQEVLNQHSGVFSELRVNTEYGSELLTLRPQ